MTPQAPAQIELVDHHCHGIVQRDLDRSDFEAYATESDWGPPPGTDVLDSPFGLVFDRLCPPALDLAPGVGLDDYLTRRRQLGWREASRRLLTASGTADYVIETGFPAPAIASPTEMSEVSGRVAHRVVRLEAVAETVAPTSSPEAFLSDFETELDRQLVGAIGVKTVAAYRFGLDLAAERPTDGDVVEAARRWFEQAAAMDRYRIDDPLLISRLVWAAVDRAAVIQVHVGFGDSDCQLDLANPSRMTPFLRATRTSGARIALLHCYPYVREAGVLAHVYPHVYFDVSCLSHYAGPSAPTLIRQALETAPFAKVLYASDAYALAEHYLISATLWRRGLGALLAEWTADGWLDPAGADRLTRMIAADNARTLYRIQDSDPAGAEEVQL